MKATPRYIKAIDPADLLDQVQDAASKEEDLYQPLFVSHEGLLVQAVVAIPCMYEYKLIVADDLDKLELQIQNLTVFGFDHMFNVVLWNGKYLQWMCRMNDTGTPAPREEELQLVEDVRAGLNIRPIAEDASLVEFPFPVRLS